jgi:hypothetical protein
MASDSLKNPYAGRLNWIIKNDYLRYYDTGSFAKLGKALNQVVWLYNNERPHSEPGNLTPVIFERRMCQKKENERMKMALYDFRNNPTVRNSPASPPVS